MDDIDRARLELVAKAQWPDRWLRAERSQTGKLRRNRKWMLRRNAKDFLFLQDKDVLVDDRTSGL